MGRLNNRVHVSSEKNDSPYTNVNNSVGFIGGLTVPEKAGADIQTYGYIIQVSIGHANRVSGEVGLL